ncbi:hypothetical protein B0H17DRAFT_1214080 [Mycena rosella]|uniref:glutathione transferase n=1 Tax=Mycena rosella TaxID=1033263 RepID=A0AAD7CNQ3_MYCRO|nr:hypothetical protein B0H17DRAFT_1214080 [Mycena rosella]
MASSENPKITLHWLNRSRSPRILWLLEEFGVPYDIKIHQRDSSTNRVNPTLKDVHPLGKSPVITVGDHTLAESAVIVEYLSEHFAPSLIPAKWKPECEGKLGGETEEYMRYRYYMHYCEGSLMPLLVVLVVSSNVESTAPDVAGKINAGFLHPNFEVHFAFLEEQLGSAPGGGPYLCGSTLTGADIMLAFSLMVIMSELGDRGLGNLKQETHPKLLAHVELLKGSRSYMRTVDKMLELDGESQPQGVYRLW